MIDKPQECDAGFFSKDAMYRCNNCGQIAVQVDGIILDKKWHPDGIGCDCSGAVFTRVIPSDLN